MSIFRELEDAEHQNGAISRVLPTTEKKVKNIFMKRSKKVAITVFALAILFTVGSIPSKGVGKEIGLPQNPQPIHIVNDRSFYEIEDLNLAASLMRQRAKSWGLDPNLRPDQKVAIGNEVQFWVGGQYLSIRDGTDEIKERVEADISIGVNENTYLVIFVSKRGLSVDEVAKILECGNRVVDLLCSETGRNIFAIAGNPKSIQALLEFNFTASVLEYLPEYKFNKKCKISSSGWYDLQCFVSVTKTLEAELRELGIDEFNSTYKSKTIEVKIREEVLDDVAALWWVRFIMPPPEDWMKQGSRFSKQAVENSVFIALS